jgi:hypothetical protein
MLGDIGFSLQANSRTREGKQHPDRDAQFQYINKTVRSFQRRGLPVISVDAKKQEIVGNFQNRGREWQPKGKPEKVRTHNFADKDLGKVIPYGVYDQTQNNGWVSVGTRPTGKPLQPPAPHLVPRHIDPTSHRGFSCIRGERNNPQSLTPAPRTVVYDAYSARTTSSGSPSVQTASEFGRTMIISLRSI